jgi:hypothetical protein
MKRALTALAAIMLASCSATGPSPGPGGTFFTGGNVTALANMAVPGGCAAVTATAPLSSNLTAVCRGIDLAALTFTTSSKPEFDYLENDQFDLQMHASMNGSVPTIKTPVPSNDKLTIAELEASTTPRPDSPRLAFWLAKIRSTGGQNLICQEGGTKGVENAFAWLLANMATDWLRDWLTYKPAGNYHAKVFVKQMTGNDYEVVRTEFVLRSKEPNPECPA